MTYSSASSNSCLNLLIEQASLPPQSRKYFPVTMLLSLEFCKSGVIMALMTWLLFIPRVINLEVNIRDQVSQLLLVFDIQNTGVTSATVESVKYPRQIVYDTGVQMR